MTLPPKFGSILLKVALVLALSFGIVTLVHAPLHDAFPQGIEETDEGSLLPLPTNLEIADTPASQRQGLSGRTELPEDYGMLFVFPKADSYGFWMKEMQIPIDIVWIDAEGTILGIEHSLSPETYPDVFYPPSPVRYVLETRAGYARQQGWEAGKQFELPPGEAGE